MSRLWVANTRAANEISELRCEELSSPDGMADDAPARAWTGRQRSTSGRTRAGTVASRGAR
ncbi:hypothetical protein BVI2075_70082 [Burkholderia vietnamiensis]|nr:hypothetical protein BVI2075_70082 [Burkholderia vietnamiensis]